MPFSLRVPVGLPPTGQLRVATSLGAFKYAVVSKAAVRLADAAPVEMLAEAAIGVSPDNMPMPDFVIPVTARHSKAFTLSR